MNKLAVRIIVPLLVGILVSTIFSNVIDNKNTDMIESKENYDLNPSTDQVPDNDGTVDDEPSDKLVDNDEDSDTAWDGPVTGGPKSSRGGELEWVYKSPKGGAVSTPALVDLDTDGYLEVVYVTTGDEIIALNYDGSKRWINSNYVIEPASYFSKELQLDFWPADLFSSITPANIDRDIRPEIILGAYNGLVFLNHDGVPKYSQAHTGRYYFSTPVVLDLEGDYSNIDMDEKPISHYKDLEIITGAENIEKHAFLESWHATGGDVFEYNVVSHVESAFVLGISAGDLDGSMEDEVYHDGEEAWMEIVYATHDRGLRIYQNSGKVFSSSHKHNHPIYDEDTSVNVQGHLSYATAAVGNFSKVINPDNPPQHEIIVGKGGWHGTQLPGNPDVSEKGLYLYDMDGKEHWKTVDHAIIVSSPAVCDVQTEDRDEETRKNAKYEIFAANSQQGEIFSIAADDGSVIWSWEIEGSKSDENRILSSPAVMNINSDDELEVVVGSDNGRVYAFDGDPSDGNNDGEEFSNYAGEGTQSFDILWEFDTHKNGGSGAIGISSPVVADIDKDGVLEVVIGDTEGNVWCISAGGSSSRGQQDWTMFHYDRNNSGFYDPKVSYGVELQMTRNDFGSLDFREKFVEPRNTVFFNITVENTGMGLSLDDYDIFYLTADAVSEDADKGWKYSLVGDVLQEHDGLKYVKLKMQESTNFYLKVTAPSSGEIGDYLSIVLRANSSMDHNAFDTLTIMTHLLIRMDFNLEFNWLEESDPLSPYYNKKLDEIIPGEERIYSLTLQNIGNINDSYRITVADYDPNWEIKFLNSETPLEITFPLDSSIFEGAENSTQLQLRVRIPNDAPGGEVLFITVEGVSQLSEKEQEKPRPLTGLIVRKDTMLIKIGDVPKLQLFTDEEEKYIMPGSTAKYKVYIKNNGNVDYNVAVSHSDPGTGWSVSMPNSASVRSGEQKLLEVFLTAPGEEYKIKAETREMINIEGSVQTDKGVLSSSVGIIGVIDHINHFNVTVFPSVNTTAPGGFAGYVLGIENLGNGDDELRLSPLSLALGWNVTFLTSDRITIQWRETIKIPFEVHVPVESLAGVYISVLNVSDSRAREKIFVNVKTDVLQSHDIGIGVYNEHHDLYTAQTTQYLTPGSSTLYDLRVTNKGNGVDTANLWLYLYQYKKIGAGGELAVVDKSPDDSDSMMKAAQTGGGIQWYFTSVQSSPGAFAVEPQYRDFAKVIGIDSTAEIRYLPDSDHDHYTHLSLLLLPGQSAWVQIEIDYPADEIMDPVYFAVDAFSDGEDISKSDNRADMILEIRYSDLAFDTEVGSGGIDIIGRLTDDNPQLNIRVRVRNIGEIDARDVGIALYIDGHYLDTRTVMRLVNSTIGNYKDIMISFAWKPVAGKHIIEVRLDPDNSIIESDEDNNVVSDKVEIKSTQGFSGWIGKRGTCPVILIIGAVVVFGLTTFFVLRKRNQERK